jgi:hypothetical protein
MVCGSLSAQTYDDLPAGFTNTADNIYDYFLLPRTSYHPLHVQYCYDLAEIANTGSPIVQSLSWRRNNYYSNAVPAGSVTMTVILGYSANTPAAMSTTFANNIAVTPTQIFQGTVNYPAAVKGTGPAPWTHVLPITKPIVFVVQKGANKSMTVDMVITATTGYTTSTYTMDASAPDGGSRTSNPSSSSTCKFSNNNYNNSLSYTTGGLNNNGGTWYVQYGSILPNAPGIMTLSAFGIDNKGTWPLPIDMTGLGAPGCKWNVGLETGVWIPVTANASGAAKIPNITIPAGLGGKSFYDHALFLDQAANKAGLVVTWSSKWYIGTGKGPSANTLYKTADTASSPTGSLRTGYGTHLRLTR